MTSFTNLLNFLCNSHSSQRIGLLFVNADMMWWVCSPYGWGWGKCDCGIQNRDTRSDHRLSARVMAGLKGVVGLWTKIKAKYIISFQLICLSYGWTMRENVRGQSTCSSCGVSLVASDSKIRKWILQLTCRGNRRSAVRWRLWAREWHPVLPPSSAVSSLQSSNGLKQAVGFRSCVRMNSNNKSVNSAAIKAEIKRHESLQRAISRLSKQLERVEDQQLRSGLQVYLHSVQGKLGVAALLWTYR